MKNKIIIVLLCLIILNMSATVWADDFSDDEYHQYVEQTIGVNLNQGDTRTFYLPSWCKITEADGLEISEFNDNMISVHIPISVYNNYSFPVLTIMCYHQDGINIDTEHTFYLVAKPIILTLTYEWDGAPDTVLLPNSFQVYKYDVNLQEKDLSIYSNIKNDFVMDYTITTEEGTYIFSGWTLEDTTFKGRWTFTANNPEAEAETEINTETETETKSYIDTYSETVNTTPQTGIQDELELTLFTLAFIMSAIVIYIIWKNY